MDSISEEKLAKLLSDAEQAHAQYEKQLGERDEDWPRWYARYILGELNK